MYEQSRHRLKSKHVILNENGRHQKLKRSKIREFMGMAYFQGQSGRCRFKSIKQAGGEGRN